MPSHYLISLGGTGARLLEAFIHLCASGVSNLDSVKVFNIDPDIGNGNWQRTQNVFQNYISCRSILNPILSADANFPYFRTDLQYAVDNVWMCNLPLGANGAGVFDHIADRDTKNPFQNHKLLMKEYKGNELGMPLDQGVRGHPNVGTVILDYALDNSVNWNGLMTQILNDLAIPGNTVYINVFCSEFGGTGASGFTVIPSKIHQRLGSPTNMHLSLVTLLPYFTHECENATLISSREWNFRTKLKIWCFLNCQMTGGVPLYEKVCFLGIPDMLNLALKLDAKESKIGGLDQCNPSHFLELFGAMAGLYFLSGGGAKNNSYYKTIKQIKTDDGKNIPHIDLDCLPLTNNQKKNLLSFSAGATCLYESINNYFINVLQNPSKAQPQFPFLSNWLNQNMELRNAEITKLENFNNYYARYLSFLGELSKIDCFKVVRREKENPQDINERVIKLLEREISFQEPIFSPEGFEKIGQDIGWASAEIQRRVFSSFENALNKKPSIKTKTKMEKVQFNFDPNTLSLLPEINPDIAPPIGSVENWLNLNHINMMNSLEAIEAIANPGIDLENAIYYSGISSPWAMALYFYYLLKKVIDPNPDPNFPPHLKKQIHCLWRGLIATVANNFSANVMGHPIVLDPSVYYRSLNNQRPLPDEANWLSANFIVYDWIDNMGRQVPFCFRSPLTGIAPAVGFNTKIFEGKVDWFNGGIQDPVLFLTPPQAANKNNYLNNLIAIYPVLNSTFGVGVNNIIQQYLLNIPL